MKTLTKSTSSKFSFSMITHFLAKMTAVTAVSLTALFSSAKAQDAAAGEALFKTKCATCHGQAGEGIAIFPPIAGSEWVNGPAENLIRIQLHGLMGPIEVKGKLYNSVMPSNAAMTDKEIADVLTYIRSSMGNSAPAVTVDMVASHRDAAKANPAPIKAEDLLDPNVVPEVKEKPLSGPTELEGYKPAEHNSSGSTIFWVIGIIGFCTLPALVGLAKN